MTGSSVAAVVVSYNVRELLIACVASLEAARESGELDDIVVVDSASADGSAAAVRAAFPTVRVVDAENAGYGAAVNVGISQTSARYVLALNPDTIVPAGTVGTLARFLDEHPWVGIAGPRLRYPDGREQPSRRRFPTRFTPVFESTTLHRRWPENPLARRYHMSGEPDSTEQLVDWIVGACMLIRRQAVDRCGGFDASFFMYSEEVELCWRFRRHGWRVAWLPAVEVIHHESASAVQDLPRRQVRFDASRVRLASRMYGPATARVIRGALLSGYLMELALECGKWLVGHRRDLRDARIRFYRDVIASRLREDPR